MMENIQTYALETVLIAFVIWSAYTVVLIAKRSRARRLRDGQQTAVGSSNGI